MPHPYRLGILAAACVIGALHAQSGATPGPSPSQPGPSPYVEVAGWPQLPPGMTLAPGLTGVINFLPDENGHVWIAQRGRPALLKVDVNGRLLTAIDFPEMYHAHGLCMDGDGNLWAGDQGLQGWAEISAKVNGPEAAGKGYAFYKFSPNGRLLQTIGTPGVSLVGNDTFGSPSACIVAPNGDVIIADGHIPRPTNVDHGDRLVRFSRDGRFIRSYGNTGSGPGEFRGPHALAYDSQGRFFVADRQNNRIQIFDRDMRFVAEWTQFGRPSGMVILQDDTLITMDSESGLALAWADWPDRNVKQPRNPGYGEGVRIGSARTGVVHSYFTLDLTSETMGAASGGDTIYAGPKKYVRRK